MDGFKNHFITPYFFVLFCVGGVNFCQETEIDPFFMLMKIE